MAALRRSMRLLPDELSTLIQAQSRPPYLARLPPIPAPTALPLAAVSQTHAFATASRPLLAANPNSQHSSDFASNPHSHATASTVDPTELSHFATLASSWWDPHGPSRLLHLMNPLRHTFITRCLSSQSKPPPDKLHYLDIGCGGGIFAETAARLKNTGSVTGIDPEKSVVEVARGHAKQDPLFSMAVEGDGQGRKRLTYLNCSIEQLSAQPECRKEGYDIVTLFEVLEHVSSAPQFLTHILPHVKPGGWIILSTIARTWSSWFVTKVMAEEVLRFVPRGTHDWRKYVNEEEVREWFGKRQGWGTTAGGVRSEGVIYVPGVGWRVLDVPGGERLGNYFFGVRRDPLE